MIGTVSLCILAGGERREFCAGDAEEGHPCSEDGTAARRNGDTSAAGPAESSEPDRPRVRSKQRRERWLIIR
jgi:hypothetical protein